MKDGFYKLEQCNNCECLTLCIQKGKPRQCRTKAIDELTDLISNIRLFKIVKQLEDVGKTNIKKYQSESRKLNLYI